MLASLPLFLLMDVHAATIYSDFGPGNTYNFDGGYVVLGPDCANLVGPGCSPDEIAMGFTPSDNYSLTQINVALQYSAGTNAVILTLSSDNNGLPGAALANWNLSGLPAIDTCCPIETVTPASAIDLSSGTQYWILASPGAADAFLTWNFNLSEAGPVAHNEGSGFLSGTGGLGAFDVLGTVVPVPEPAGLFSAAGLGLLFRFHS